MSVVAVYGTGPSTRKTANALLDDWHTANPIDKLIGISEDLPEGAALHALDWAHDHEVPLVWATFNRDPKPLEPFGRPVAKSNVLDVIEQLPVSDVFIAWDETQNDHYDTLTTEILCSGLKTYDFTDGLSEIELGPDAEPAPEEVASAPKQIAEPADEAQSFTSDVEYRVQDQGQALLFARFQEQVTAAAEEFSRNLHQLLFPSQT